MHVDMPADTSELDGFTMALITKLAKLNKKCFE